VAHMHNAARNPVRSMQMIVVLAIVGGLGIGIGIGLSSGLGASGWWHVLRTRELGRSPYDLLFSTIAGANVVMLALYFTIAGALVVADPSSRGANAQSFSSWWVAFPSLLEAFCVAILGSRAWGFPPFSGALLTLAALGSAASLAYVGLAGHLLSFMHSSRGIPVTVAETIEVELSTELNDAR